MDNRVDVTAGLEELKWVNCPFCNTMDAWVYKEDDRFYTKCGCGARGPLETTPDRARRAWNTRNYGGSVDEFMKPEDLLEES